MHVSRIRNGARRARNRRRFRKSQRGVVSVVGTLLALLVFFALFGIFITQYVPLWMTDNEAAWTAQMQTSMATFKANVDSQIAFRGPPSYSTPFVMSSQGVPLFAAPTGATLNYIPKTPGVFASVSMSVGPGGQTPFAQNVSLGVLTSVLPNRYFPIQTFEFEDDAVIQSQGDTQQLVAYAPLFSVNTSGGYVAGTVSLVQLFGNATQVISSGTVDVSSHFVYAQTFQSNGGGAPFSVTVVVGTLYPCAWATYFAKTLGSSGLSTPGEYVVTPSSCVPANGVPTPVTVKLFGVSAFTLVLAYFNLATGVGIS